MGSNVLTIEFWRKARKHVVILAIVYTFPLRMNILKKKQNASTCCVMDNWKGVASYSFFYPPNICVINVGCYVPCSGGTCGSETAGIMQNNVFGDPTRPLLCVCARFTAST